MSYYEEVYKILKEANNIEDAINKIDTDPKLQCKEEFFKAYVNACKENSEIKKSGLKSVAEKIVKNGVKSKQVLDKVVSYLNKKLKKESGDEPEYEKNPESRKFVAEYFMTDVGKVGYKPAEFNIFEGKRVSRRKDAKFYVVN